MRLEKNLPQADTQQLACIECRRVWIDPSERWRLYLAPDDRELVPYCGVCASREFDA